MMGFGDSGGGLGGGLLMLLFWGVLVVAAIVGVRWLRDQGGSPRGHARDESPLQILEQRYARGEIERDEFEMKRRDLERR